MSNRVASSEIPFDQRIAPDVGSDLSLWPAIELAALIRRRAISPVDLVEIYLDRIEQENQALNAYVLIAADAARAAARAAEATMMSGYALGALHGVPIAVKDDSDVTGLVTTCGSRLLAGSIAKTDNPVIARMKRAGAIVLGKTNLPEFGQSAITDNKLFGPTRSPIAPQMNSLGSSGGSAAAVAGGLTALAHGSDGGGSIRIPASACGVFGLKASWGRVPTGIRPNAFLHAPMVGLGPLTRWVADAALMMSVIDGASPSDPFTFALPELDYLAACQREVGNLRVAFSPTIGGHLVSAEVRDVIGAAVARLESIVAGVEEIEPQLRRPMSEVAEAWMTAASVSSAAIDRRLAGEGIPLYDEHRDELTSYFAESIVQGRAVGAVDYFEIGLLRTELFDAVESIFESFDLIVGPTLAIAGVENATDGSLTQGPATVEGREVPARAGWALTYPFNFTGHPAASVPVGVTADDVPVGLQVIGRRFHDDDVLALSAAIERMSPWQHRYPSPNEGA
ncbi:MAG TPA: amidase [Solirubrobacteraceae bacterium]|nr:amidase [Solirubrobacteraceae bacterium]